MLWFRKRTTAPQEKATDLQVGATTPTAKGDEQFSPWGQETHKLRDEIFQLRADVARLTNALHEKTTECNAKSQELSDFLYHLGQHEVTISAGKGDQSSYFYDVEFHPAIGDPSSPGYYKPYDCTPDGRRFDIVRIGELIRIVAMVGLGDWKVGDCSSGFHLRMRFGSDGIFHLDGAIKEAEAGLQKLVNELYHLKALKSVIEVKEG